MKTTGWPSEKRLKILNKILLAFIIVANGYIVILPVLPKADFVIKQHITKPVKVKAGDDNSLKYIDRSRNHLILPTIQLDELVYDGINPSTVHKGIWRRPNTSVPENGSNTVLVGHRFTYAGAAVFYNLDKLKINDDVYLVYSQKIYRYKITSSSVVPPTAVEVEAPSNETRLTLYTCAPLLTAKNRLVYIAELKEVL